MLYLIIEGDNMKSQGYIEYTYKHRKVVMLLAEKYFGDNKELLEQVRYHDLDKMYLYMFYDKDVVSKFHRKNSNHHFNEKDKTNLDYIEMVLDWESARYTKPDKPLNAYDTLYKYYTEEEKNILPILKEMLIDKPNLPMEKDILDKIKSITSISFNDIEKELYDSISLIIGRK